MSEQPFLELQGVSKAYELNGGLLGRWMGKRRALPVVSDVNLKLFKGQAVGLVGESGSGKTTTAHMIMRLTSLSSGRLLFKGEDIGARRERDLVDFRRKAQMVFQDSQSALNPRKTIARTLAEAVRRRHGRSAKTHDHIMALLQSTGLPADILERYPHTLSGGQRQRVGIARALAMEPEFIVADEPVASLDVSLQSQIIKLLERLRRERDLTMLFISHDLALVHHLCDTVAVMAQGQVVEFGSPKEIFKNPSHEYTKALLSAIPGSPQRK